MGSENGQFTGMGPIALSRSCAIYVTGIYNYRLQMFTPTEQGDSRKGKIRAIGRAEDAS